MATKDFTKMTTKKLNALLETASDEDKVAIQEVLDARAQVETPELPAGQGWVGGESEETNEEAYEEAEANGGKLPKQPRRTDEEVEALAEECKANIGHKCQVMPFNNPEWLDGVIIAVRGDKRAHQVFYAIKLDNGKSCVKAYDSNMLRIFDETVEMTSVARGPRTKKAAWTEETMQDAINDATQHVGKLVTLEDGSVGRITTLVPDKRSCTILYRIVVPTPTETDPDFTKTVHKASLKSVILNDELDEEGATLNEKFIARRERAASKAPVTPETKLLAAQEAVAKAEASLAKAQEILEARKAALEVAKQEFDAYVANQELA